MSSEPTKRIISSAMYLKHSPSYQQEASMSGDNGLLMAAKELMIRDAKDTATEELVTTMFNYLIMLNAKGLKLSSYKRVCRKIGEFFPESYPHKVRKDAKLKEREVRKENRNTSKELKQIQGDLFK